MKYDITDLDKDQIVRYSYDPVAQAQRVIITGDFGITEAIKEQLKDLKVEVKTEQQPLATMRMSEPQIIHVEKPIVVEKIEYKEIEKPFIVEKVVYKEIEKPVIVREVQFERIEVPVVQEQKQVVEVRQQDSKFLKLIFIIQTVTLIAYVLSNFVRN